MAAAAMAAPHRLMMRRRLVALGQILFSGALLLFLLLQIDRAQLLEVMGSVSLPLLGLTFGIQIGGVLISALKWWFLLRAAGLRLPYRWTVETYLTGQFFSNFLPTMIGGDAVRAYQVNQQTGRLTVALASIFVERLTGFVALTAIGWVALGLSADALNTGTQLLWPTTAALGLATVVVAAAFAAPVMARVVMRLRVPNIVDWRGKLQKVAQQLAGYLAYPRTLGIAVMLSFGYHLIWISVHGAAARALGLEIPAPYMALMVPISDIVGLVPIFFNNLGAREGTFILLLGARGAGAPEAIALAFLVFTVRLFVSLLGGAFYLSGRLTSVRPERPAPREHGQA